MTIRTSSPSPPPPQEEPSTHAVRAIIYGSTATPIIKPDSEHTHRWTAYVRGFGGEEVGGYVQRVVFRLHESFPNPTRVVESAPFEVSETGWGEFELQIRLFFQDPQQKPLLLTHHLRLYPPEESSAPPTLLKTTRPVISEHYEEIIFDPPTTLMQACLAKGAAVTLTEGISSTQRYAEWKQVESEEMQKIKMALQKARAQLNEAEIKLAQSTPAERNLMTAKGVASTPAPISAANSTSLNAPVPKPTTTSTKVPLAIHPPIAKIPATLKNPSLSSTQEGPTNLPLQSSTSVQSPSAPKRLRSRR